MKANSPKRKIFDAVDMLTEESSAHEPDGVQVLPLNKIKTFHDHPFHLYEGERLQDMVESIKEHGVLTPVIVQKKRCGYEMLSGHNRANAAKMAGLTEIPAIVKEGLTEQEAYVYVIETNMIQRSFNDLLPSEKAAVMAEQYDKTCCQGKRSDIIRELEILAGNETESTCGHNGHKLKSRDVLAREYGFSSRNAARYLRLNYLIRPFKDMMDRNEIPLLSAVDVSYMPEEEQQALYDLLTGRKLKLMPKMAAQLRKASGDLDEGKMLEIVDGLKVKKQANGVSLTLPAAICSKYFEGMNAEQMASLVEQALEAWFAGKEAAHVQ